MNPRLDYNSKMAEYQIVDVPIEGMDCADCTRHVKRAIESVSGVEAVEVYLTSEKAVIRMRRDRVDLTSIRKAVEGAGYSVPDKTLSANDGTNMRNYTRAVMTLLGGIFGLVLFVVVVGEWLGLFEKVSEQIPWYIGLIIVLIIGYPIYLNVIRSTLRGQVIAHTLMTLGVLAALAIGQWVTAAVVAFFMRVGDFVEQFTTERARRAVKDLTAMAPQTARVERSDQEVILPIDQVSVGDTVVVRPGEVIPVDGEVIGGYASIDQASITGEAMLVDVGPGSHVYGAAFAHGGGLRILVKGVGADSTFGKVIKQVEDAEAHKADVHLVADRFSAYFLPVVAGVAALTFIIGRDPSATAAVLVVACSCAFALATPVAMLASIGAGAKRGLMFKGGKYLELLAKADVLLIDKTGTLTLGKPHISEIVVFDDAPIIMSESVNQNCDIQSVILQFAGSAEKYSEHPVAEAIRQAARALNLELYDPRSFEAIPGIGVKAEVQMQKVEVGNERMVSELGAAPLVNKRITVGANSGKTIVYVVIDNKAVGALVVADQLRPEVPEAIRKIHQLGIQKVEVLTGDNHHVAVKLAEELGIPFRAELLPEDKIRIVKEYQSEGYTVVMIGDGVNDAPALAQADVGIAMGAAGSDIAIEAAHIAVMREDWNLIPESIGISRRTMRVVKANIGFTAVYNILGVSLAALGILSPILAAAAQSIPDLGILANSSRLLRQK